jgi:hypothetical protein
MEAGRCQRLSLTRYTGSGGRARVVGAFRVIRSVVTGAGLGGERAGPELADVLDVGRVGDLNHSTRYSQLAEVASKATETQ